MIDQLFNENKLKIKNILQKKYINHYGNLKDIMQDIYIIMKEREDTLEFDHKEKFVSYAVKVGYSIIKKIQQHDKHNIHSEDFYEIADNEINDVEIDYNILYTIAFNELKNLTLLEEAIIKARIYSKITFTELSKSLGIERTKVFRIHKEGLKKLKEMVLEKYSDVEEWN